MKDKIQIYIVVIILLAVISLIVYGGYELNRYMNWSFGYEDMVEEKIREMVKEEYLNDK